MHSIVRMNNWPIAVKLLAAILLVTLVPLGVLGYLEFRTIRQEQLRTTAANLRAEAEKVSSLVAEVLAEKLAVLRSLAVSDTVRHTLQERNAGYKGSQEEIVDALLALDATWGTGSDTEPLIATTLSRDPRVNPVTHLLANYKVAFADYAELVITDGHGGIVGSTDRLSKYYQADEAWWKAATHSGQGAMYISDPKFDERTHVPALFMALPIFSELEQDRIIGVVRSTVTLDAVVRLLAAIHIGDSGRVMLLNKQGGVIADPNGAPAVQLPQPLIEQLATERGSIIYGLKGAANEPTDFTMFGSARLRLAEAQGRQERAQALQKLGWITVARQPTTKALAPALGLVRKLVLPISIIAIMITVVAYILARRLTRQVDRIRTLADAIGRGDYDARAEVLSGDELGAMTTALNSMLDNTLSMVQYRAESESMQTAIFKLLNEVSDVAEGDLTVEAEVTEDATGAIADAFNHMIHELRRIVTQVQNASLQVSSSVTQIQATTERLAEGSTAQSGQIVDSSAALDEMAVSIQQVSEHAALSATVAEQALANATRGASSVQNTIEGMNRIRTQVQETGKRIKRLGERSQEVGEIVQMIGDIADRTSILALNASIQAARAGEAGRSFVVVAEEVERLAERSANATKQIAGLVNTIQSETNEAVMAMEESTHEVVQGSQVADQAGQALGEIESVTHRLAELIQSISLAASQQARGSENLSKAMGEISEVTQQTAAGTKQAASSISHLADFADELRNSVSTFKLPTT